jgi:hypothetical protein
MSIFTKKKKFNEIPLEAAKEQVKVFLEFYEIDPEEDGSNQAHRESLEASVKRLTKHVMKGRVEITEADDGRIKILQRLQFKSEGVTELEYKLVGGNAKKNMKNAEDNDLSGKIYNLVGAMTGISGKAIANLEALDLSAVECLGVLFLAQ